MTQQDHFWMEQAIALAQEAAAVGEVPVGALLVKDNVSIGTGYNRVIGLCDPTAHAEVLALREAAHQLGNYRLVDSTLYVTLEPCPMCAGAMVHARVNRLVFGASDPRTGACGSVYNLVQSDYLNHQVEITAGILGEICGGLLRKFFRERR
jgi:tRNA(adenine34) deaminase